MLYAMFPITGITMARNVSCDGMSSYPTARTIHITFGGNHYCHSKEELPLTTTSYSKLNFCFQRSSSLQRNQFKCIENFCIFMFLLVLKKFFILFNGFRFVFLKELEFKKKELMLGIDNNIGLFAPLEQDDEEFVVLVVFSRPEVIVELPLLLLGLETSAGLVLDSSLLCLVSAGCKHSKLLLFVFFRFQLKLKAVASLLGGFWVGAGGAGGMGGMATS
uniref:Uncharacterized protein n=1 Tax=Glossina austeni TaxID=7395 RepID=A0A1A9VTI1_GLOAU